MMSERLQQTGIDPLLDDLEKRGWQVELMQSGTIIELRREGVTIVANGSTWFASVKMVADGVEMRGCPDGSVGILEKRDSLCDYIEEFAGYAERDLIPLAKRWSDAERALQKLKWSLPLLLNTEALEVIERGIEMAERAD